MKPAPKPEPRPKRERSWNTTLPRPKKRIGANRKRQRKLFERNYDSDAYVEHMRSLPCDICGVRGYSVAAHAKGRGAGGDASKLVSLCCSRYGVKGCHERYDHNELLEHKPRLLELAAQRWKEWTGHE